jgi:uncharacterized protein (TIGR03437 family)
MRIIFFLVLAATLNAAPRLRLVQTVVNVPVVPGNNGPLQTVDALNAGDGQLHLQATSSVTWLVPSIGQTDFCGLLGRCTPVQIALQTSSLAKGTYTGTITVSDPNALDAPQFVTVTVAVGGSVPDKLEFFVPPDGAASSTFSTVSAPNIALSNSAWLATFVGASQVRLVLTALNLAPGDYNGSVTITGSSFAPDNKTVSVLLHVTTQPILRASPATVQFKIPQGASKQTAQISIANAGQGTLTLSSSGVTANAPSGKWLSVQGDLQGLTIAADPSGLSPNTYSGTITIASNAANSSVTVPVQLEVLAPTPPIVFAGGVVNNGTFSSDASVAQGEIVALFGNQLTYGDPQKSSSLPLPNIIAGIQVLVNGQAVPLYYIGPGQIDFEVPIDASLGDGTVQVVRNGQAGNLAYINIKDRAPHFLLLNGGPYAIMTSATPDLTGIPSHPAKAGDALVIYTIGLGPTSPSVPSGTASPSPPDQLATVTPATQVCFGVPTPFFPAPCATPFFVGLSPGFVGLYQINVFIPQDVPSGNTPLYFLVNGVPSDTVQLAVQ